MFVVGVPRLRAFGNLRVFFALIFPDRDTLERALLGRAPSPGGGQAILPLLRYSGSCADLP
jgi:hypothetical protein